MLNIINLFKYNYLEISLPLVLTIFTFFNRFFYTSLILLHVTLFTLWKFHNRSKFFKEDPKNYLSPVEGVVKNIKTEVSCPYLEGSWKCISIETGIWDPVMQYSPISGSIVSIKSLEVNEDLSWFLYGQTKILDFFYDVLGKFICKSVLVTEINDLIQKTHCIIETTVNYVPRKKIFGLIDIIRRIKYSGPIERARPIGTCPLSLGHYTNVYFPLDCQIEVQIGQSTIAGETVIARQVPQLGPVIFTLEVNNEETSKLLSIGDDANSNIGVTILS